MLSRKFSLLPTLLLSVIGELSYAHVSSDQSFLGDSLVRQNPVQNVLEHEPVKVPGCSHVPTGPIETTQCDYETIESVTDKLFNNLHELVRTPFFKYFRVDLYRECPFWDESGLCSDRNCGVDPVDESEIPERWRSANLGKLYSPSEDQKDALPGCYYRDSDYCFLDDPAEGEFVDLIENPEKFTGYAGPSAHRVWSTIYNENCFGISELDLLSSPNPEKISLPDTMMDVLNEEGAIPAPSEECLEKRVYYKIISGLHASISTHLCHEFFNQSTGEWSPNLQCFVSRVASHPERLQYIYFDTVLLLRAIARLGPYLSAYDYCSTGTHEEDAYTLEKLSAVIDIAERVGQFDESVLFRGENANVLKEEFKSHFRNVTRIMDCVGCDKCKLWGKIQTTGTATALKVLFEMDEKTLDPQANPNLLTRSEVVALVNTLHRLTESLYFVNNFRRMWSAASEEESSSLIRVAAEAVARNRQTSPPLAGFDHEETQALGQRQLYAVLKQRLWNFISLCRRCTTDCVQTCRQILDTVVDMLRSSLTGLRTDKKRGLHTDL